MSYGHVAILLLSVAGFAAIMALITGWRIRRRRPQPHRHELRPVDVTFHTVPAMLTSLSSPFTVVLLRCDCLAGPDAWQTIRLAGHWTMSSLTGSRGEMALEVSDAPEEPVPAAGSR